MTSTANGVGLRLGAGDYSGTLIAGNELSENIGNGLTMTSAQGVTIGGLGADGNAIIFNGGRGISASGTSTGSALAANQISNNALGSMQNLTSLRSQGWRWFNDVAAGPAVPRRRACRSVGSPQRGGPRC